MTLAEFKAWFEGFTEDMDAAPTPKQWKRIKARVAQIDGIAITREVVYRDRYWPTLIGRPAEPYVSWSAANTGSAAERHANGMIAVGSGIADLAKAEYQALGSA